MLAPLDRTVVSNTPVTTMNEETLTLPSGRQERRKRWKFAETPIMSTYLLALVSEGGGRGFGGGDNTFVDTVEMWLYCLCCGVLWCGVLWCGLMCCAVLCCTVLCFVVLRCAVLCCAVLCCAALCCVVLCCVMLCFAFAVLWCAVLCCAVLCCAVLCCAVLRCAVLRCVVLYGAVPGTPLHLVS